MLHALLDIVMQEQKAPPNYKTDRKWELLHVPETIHVAKTLHEEDSMSKGPNNTRIGKEDPAPAPVAFGQGQGQGSHEVSPAETSTKAA